MEPLFYDALEARDPAAREASLDGGAAGDRRRGERAGAGLSPSLCARCGRRR